MAEVILMPRLSDTMTEGVIAAWHKKVGDPVKKGELLAELVAPCPLFPLRLLLRAPASNAANPARTTAARPIAHRPGFHERRCVSS